MELWIRSQKNENLRPMLLKVTEFEIGDYVADEDCIVVNNLHCVGIYKTKERALEVLDEIQSILMPKCIINSKSIKLSKPYEENGMVLMDCNADARLEQLSTYVYEMPQEQKVKCRKLKLNKETKKLYEEFKNIYKLPNGKDIRDLIKKLEDTKKEVSQIYESNRFIK